VSGKKFLPALPPAAHLHFFFDCLALSFFGLRIFYVLALALLVYVYYRMFSRNMSKRSAIIRN